MGSVSLEDLPELLELIPTFKPIVKQALDGLAEYSEEVERIRGYVIRSTVKTKAGIYKGLLEEGIPADHALALTINSLQEYSKTVTNVINNTKGKK